MSLARIQQRAPSARRLGCYSLSGHTLQFHKLSHDDSGKCDAYFTGQEKDVVFGALFEIDPIHQNRLDQAEGRGAGYEVKSVSVRNTDNNVMEAFTYYATRIDSSLKPYSWYLAHVLIGAEETGLPEGYIQIIRTVESIQDSNQERDAKERSIHHP